MGPVIVMRHEGRKREGGVAGRGPMVLLAMALLTGCASTGAVEERHPDDPWEGFNRRVFAFNDALDRAILRPVARGYRNVTPQPVQTGVGNFFSNLGEIRTALNSVLQGKPGNAGIATSRFLINTTVGIGGLWDFATHMEITGREEDFGQTLGVWGVNEGPYLVLPFLGPSTVRDTAGLPLDMYTYPVTHVEDDKVRYGLTGLRVVDARAGLLDQEELIRARHSLTVRRQQRAKQPDRAAPARGHGQSARCAPRSCRAPALGQLRRLGTPRLHRPRAGSLGQLLVPAGRAPLLHRWIDGAGRAERDGRRHHGDPRHRRRSLKLSRASHGGAKAPG